jgi:hypothetical protein
VAMRTAPLASALLCSMGLLATTAFAQRDLAAEASRKPGDAVAGQPECTWQHRGGWVVDCPQILTTAPEPPRVDVVIPPPAGDDNTQAMEVARLGIFLPGWRYTLAGLNDGRIVVLTVTNGLDGRVAVVGQWYYHANPAIEGTLIAFTPGEAGAPAFFAMGRWPVGTILSEGWRLDQMERGR